MQKVTENVCSNLLSEKTSVLFVGKESSSIYEEFLRKNPKIESYIEGKSYQKNSKQCGDIFIVNTDCLDEKSKFQVIKNIYKSNPKAYLFLVDSKKDLSELGQKIQPFLDPIKLGQAIQGIINPQEKDFSKVVACISFMEDTKTKLGKLWEKLEKDCA